VERRVVGRLVHEADAYVSSVRTCCATPNARLATDHAGLLMRSSGPATDPLLAPRTARRYAPHSRASPPTLGPSSAIGRCHCGPGWRRRVSVPRARLVARGRSSLTGHHSHNILHVLKTFEPQNRWARLVNQLRDVIGNYLPKLRLRRELDRPIEHKCSSQLYLRFSARQFRAHDHSTRIP
jgi:hypothetical protein